MKTESHFAEMQQLRNRLGGLFDELLRDDPYFHSDMLAMPHSPVESNYRKPHADFWETDDAIIAELELPGIDKKDIHIQLSENTIEITAESKHQNEQKKKGMYRLERNYAGFYRNFIAPHGIDTEKTKAAYKAGVLRIVAPKKAKKVEGRKTLSIS